MKKKLYLTNIQKIGLLIILTGFLLIFTTPAQQIESGTLRGKIVDAVGALVQNSTVTVIDTGGRERKVQTNQDGIFVINNLPNGKYILRANAMGF